MKTCNISAKVRSSQTEPHSRLAECVQKHLRTEWRHIPQRPTVEAFETLTRQFPLEGQKIVLDSGCGNGDSTRLIGAIL